MKRTIITLLVLGYSASLFNETIAHGGHDHGHAEIQTVLPIEHPFVLGDHFEVVVERCETDKVYLYISDRQTNHPIPNARIETVVSGDVKLEAQAQHTHHPGVYFLSIRAQEMSKVTLDFKVSTPKLNESLSLIVPQWPKSSKKCPL